MDGPIFLVDIANYHVFYGITKNKELPPFLRCKHNYNCKTNVETN